MVPENQRFTWCQIRCMFWLDWYFLLEIISPTSTFFPFTSCILLINCTLSIFPLLLWSDLLTTLLTSASWCKHLISAFCWCWNRSAKPLNAIHMPELILLGLQIIGRYLILSKNQRTRNAFTSCILKHKYKNFNKDDTSIIKHTQNWMFKQISLKQNNYTSLLKPNDVYYS